MSVAPGSYVSPFAPTSQSTSAVSGGTTSGLFDLVGPRFRATAYSGKSQVLLYRGGVRVLAAPGISTQTRVLEGPSLTCGSDVGIGRPPVASCTTLGSCYGKKYAVKKSGAGCPRRPVPKKMDEKFLANRSILPAFNIDRSQFLAVPAPAANRLLPRRPPQGVAPGRHARITLVPHSRCQEHRDANRTRTRMGPYRREEVVAKKVP